MSKYFAGNDDFLVVAGDTYIISKNNDFLRRIIRVHDTTNSHATSLVVSERDPRKYGVAEVAEENGNFRVTSVVEKPKRPRSNLAIIPIYMFKPDIFEILSSIKPGIGGEIQLTDAIQRLIKHDYNVYAVKLNKKEIRLDIGTPQTYWDAIARAT
jgi:dTDP-glucose pyrophosphorylase